ncbi:TPA: TIR domain-containing protein, partial [Klebsiella pneumoniae]|nr:nucleotide-binding protein [Klebsiella pneumoniae]
MSKDIFADINNVVLDLQASQAQTYERPLKKLAQLLKHPDLEPYNKDLVADLDWPEDPRKELGLTLLLIWKLGADPSYAVHFSINFFYSGKKIISNIHALTGQLIIPFIRDYKNYIQSKGIPQTMLTPPLSKKVFIVHGHDEGSREKVARFLERLGLEAIILHEQANR